MIRNITREKFIFAVVVLCYVVVAVSGRDSSSEKNALVVGMKLQFPFETVDVSGNPRGFTVDFVHALGAQLGRKIEIRNIPWAGLIPAVQSGQINVVISSMFATEEYKKSVDFSIPYGIKKICLFKIFIILIQVIILLLLKLVLLQKPLLTKNFPMQWWKNLILLMQRY